MTAETPEDIRSLLAGRPWGYFLADGTFIEVPKLPLINSGCIQPPFSVETLHKGTLEIVEKPEEPKP